MLLRSAGSLRATANRRSFSEERGGGTGPAEGEDTVASGDNAPAKYVRLHEICTMAMQIDFQMAR